MRIFIAIAGVLAGILITAFGLLQDPLGLFDGASTAPVPEPAQLVVNGRVARGITADAAGMIGAADAQVDAFADSVLRHARLAVVLLDSADGGAQALAVKLSATRADNSLLRGRLAADSAWNLMWPGHGSLFLTGRDDYRPLLADQVTNLLTGQGFDAPVPPRAIVMSPRLMGAGGRLTPALGTYQEYWFPDSGGELELGLTDD